MDYLSTRGGSPAASFERIALDGLAPDGGLYVPRDYPQVSADELRRWRGLPYAALAFEVLRKFAPTLPADALRSSLADTYDARTFGSAEVTPLHTLQPGLHLLRLSNGPTLAFKDIAMQWLGRLFEHLLARDGGTLTILGATSGDTGPAAEHALRGRRGLTVFMLSPQGRMSPFQRAQMYSLTDANIVNLAVDGSFDDCQALVKTLSADADFRRRLRLGAINSINWARLAAQLVYYFKAWLAVTEGDGQPVSFAVPSGNFGNACAGHVARCMGLPIHSLVVATNENDVLDEFFRSGRYRPRALARETSSPSMDISRASNLERFVFDVAGRDPDRLRALWSRLASDGEIDLQREGCWGEAARFGFLSGTSTHADRLRTIRAAWQQHGLEIDPHTADGLYVGLRHREPGVPLVCLETALPAKFEATMAEALGRPPARPAGFDGLEARPQRCISVGNDAEALRRLMLEHVARG
jgi:threonine synthase